MRSFVRGFLVSLSVFPVLFAALFPESLWALIVASFLIGMSADHYGWMAGFYEGFSIGRPDAFDERE